MNVMYSPPPQGAPTMTPHANRIKASGAMAMALAALLALLTVLFAPQSHAQGGVAITGGQLNILESPRGSSNRPSGSYTVVLLSDPGGDSTVVTVTPQGAPGRVQITPSVLRFSGAAGNWNAPQSIRIVVDSDDNAIVETITIRHAVANYAGVTSAADVTLVVGETDTAGVTLTSGQVSVVESPAGSSNRPSASYTVVLDSDPGDDADEATIFPQNVPSRVRITPSSLVFSGAAGNWNTPQSFNIVVDSDANANVETIAISHRVTGYAGAAPSLSLVVTETDTAGVMFSRSDFAVLEGSNEAYTVALTAQPVGAQVQVSAVLPANAPFTINPASRTFTDANWNQPQQFMVLGTQDDDAVDSGTHTITHTVTSTAPSYSALDVSGYVVTARVTDDDSVGVTVAGVTTLAAAESPATQPASTTDSFTVVLDAAPTGGDAVVEISAPDAPPGVGNVRLNGQAAPLRLTFSSTTWRNAQLVQVSAVNDDDAVGGMVTLVFAVSGGDFGGAPISGINNNRAAVAVTDPDVARVIISANRIAPGEGGAGNSNTYTVRLNSAPVGGDVIIRPGGNDPAVATLSGALVFTAANWNMVQVVSVTGAEDGDGQDEDPFTIVHTIEGSSDYMNVDTSGNTVVATVFDNDPRGVTVSTTGFTLVEGVDSGSYSINLDTQPFGGNVVITPTSGHAGVRVTPSTLVFTPNGWHPDIGQDVRVQVLDDTDAVDVGRVTITHAVAGADYEANGIDSATFVVVVAVDDDSVGVQVTSGSPLLIDEGESATYSVALTSSPARADGSPGGNVVVTPSSSNAGTARVVPTSLVFTAATWNVPQLVTIGGVQDDDAVLDGSVVISHQVTTTDTGSDYNNFHAAARADDIIAPADVVVTVDDDDSAGVRASIASPLLIPEANTLTYDVVLTSLPARPGGNLAGDVIIEIVSNNTRVVEVSPSQLVFPAASWNVPQQVHIYGVNDDNAIPDGSVMISHRVSTADTASDYYNFPANARAARGGQVLQPPDVVVTVEDDDRPPEVVVTPLRLDLEEASTTVDADMDGFYTVVLTSEPAGNSDRVTINLNATMSDTAQVTISPSTLVFTSGSWNGRQTVFVSALDDDDAVDGTVTITHTIATGSAVEYLGGTLIVDDARGTYDFPPVPVPDVVVAVRDFDVPQILITPLALSVYEGASDYYAVRLGTLPVGGDVTITPGVSHTDSVGVASDLSATTGRLIFSAANWRQTQTVQVSALVDANGLGEAVSITHSDVEGADYGRFFEGAMHGDFFDGAPEDRIPPVVIVNLTDAQGSAALDALNAIILPEVARAITDQQVGAIARRVRHAGEGEPGGASFNLGGQSTLAGMAAAQADTWANGELNMKTMLGGSDFTMPLSSLGADGSGGVFWGGGEYSAIGGKVDTTEWEGSLFSLQLGVDTRLRDNMLAGLMLSRSEADIDDYEYVDEIGNQQTGVYELDITSVLPYIGWSALGGKIDLWATVGAGKGDVTITPDSEVGEHPPSTGEVNTRTAALGGSGELGSGKETTLRLKGEAFVTEADFEGNPGDALEGAAPLSDLDVRVGRVRIALEAERNHTTDGGGVLSPSLEIGVRHDSGDGETGSGVEVGGGLRYTSDGRGVAVEGHGRALVGHSGEAEDWGVGGSLHFAAGADGQGLALSLSPGYGNTAGGVKQMWENGIPDANKATDLHARLDTQIAYGTTTHGHRLTPYSHMSMGEKNRAYRLGVQWGIDRYHLDIFANRKEKPSAPANHGVWLEGRVSF